MDTAHARPADLAELSHRLQVPVVTPNLPGGVGIEHVAPLVSARVQEARAVARILRDAGGNLPCAAEQLPSRPQKAETEVAVVPVVEGRPVLMLDRTAHKTQQAPGWAFPVCPGGVEGLAHVGSVAGGDEPLQVELEVLLPHPRLDRRVPDSSRVLREGQAQVELVGVRRPQHPFREGARILQFDERAPVLVQVQVGVSLEALQQVGVLPVA